MEPDTLSTPEKPPQAASALSDISPSIGKFLERSTIPYWSPETQLMEKEDKQNLQENPIQPMSSLMNENYEDENISGLAADAKEFVPSFATYGNEIVEEYTEEYTNDKQESEGFYGDGNYETNKNEIEVTEETSWYPSNISQTYSKVNLDTTTISTRSLESTTVSDAIRQHYVDRAIESMKQMSPSDIRYKEIPSRFQVAYSLDADPQDETNSHSISNHRSFGYPSSIYKVIDSNDSCSYVLRRFDQVKTSQAIVDQVFTKISLLKSIPSVVPLCDIIYEKSNSSTIYLLYEYLPLAASLQDYFFSSSANTYGNAAVSVRGNGNGNNNPGRVASTAGNTRVMNPSMSKSTSGNTRIDEDTLWNVFIQLIIGMRTLHVDYNQAIRVVDIQHILVTTVPSTASEIFQVRYNGVGILDILEMESRKSVTELQQEDVYKLAQVIISLGLELTTTTISKSILLDQYFPYFQNYYSSELCEIIHAILTSQIQTVDVLSSHPNVISHLYHHVNNISILNQTLYTSLGNEYDNGRLLRILLKLGFVNERPGLWSENGDKYLLKLFRDYLFHQSYPNDANTTNTLEAIPCIDVGHVISSLNKLDVQVNMKESSVLLSESEKKLLNEEILMTSRDNKDIVVVNYGDIARYVCAICI